MLTGLFIIMVTGSMFMIQKSINALKKAQANGVKVFISTARPHDSLKLTGFFDIFKPDGMILSNGAVIFVGDEIIFHDYMEPDLVNRVCEVAKKHFNSEIETKKVLDFFFSI